MATRLCEFCGKDISAPALSVPFGHEHSAHDRYHDLVAAQFALGWRHAPELSNSAEGHLWWEYETEIRRFRAATEDEIAEQQLLAEMASQLISWEHLDISHVLLPVITIATAVSASVATWFSALSGAVSDDHRPAPVDTSDVSLIQWIREFFQSEALHRSARLHSVTTDEELPDYFSRVLNFNLDQFSSLTHAHARGIARRLATVSRLLLVARSLYQRAHTTLVEVNNALPLSMQVNDLFQVSAPVSIIVEALNSLLPGTANYQEAAALAAAIRDQIITTSSRTFHVGNLVDAVNNALPAGIRRLAPPEADSAATSRNIVNWVASLGREIIDLRPFQEIVGLLSTDYEVDTNQAPAQVVNDLVKKIQAEAPGPSRPSWLPAWATEEFFRNPANAEYLSAPAPAPAPSSETANINAALVEALQNLRPADRSPRAPSARDLPEFDGSMDNYHAWKASIERATVAAGVTSVEDVRAALGSALSRLTGAASVWAQSLDLANFRTLDQFLTEMDDTFTSPTYVDDLQRSFATWRPAAGTTWSNFIINFEAKTRELKWFTPVNRVTANSRLSEAFVAKINKETRERLVQFLGVLSTQNYNTLKEAAAVRWVTTARPSRPSPAQTQPARTPQPPAPTNLAPRTNNKCGVTLRYDDAPAVPQELRGPVFRWAGKNREPFSPEQTRENEARNQRCRAAGVCLSCRRPRSAHGVGNNFAPVPAFAAPGAQAAVANGDGC